MENSILDNYDTKQADTLFNNDDKAALGNKLGYCINISNHDMETGDLLVKLLEKICELLLNDIFLLRSVVLWQKKTIDYQALYTAFLMDCMSEDEFELEAKKFTIHQKAIKPEKIVHDIKRLYELTQIEFDTSDYADYFQCNQQNILEGLKFIPQENFKKMLPKLDK